MVQEMAKREALQHLQEIYEENMWFRDGDKTRLEALIEAQDLSVEDVDRILEDHKGDLDKAKEQFVRYFSRTAEMQAYYCAEEILYPAGRESVICIRGRYHYQRLAGKFKVIISPYYNYGYKAAQPFVPYTVTVEAQDRKIEVPYTFDHEDKYNVTVFHLFEGQEMLMFTTCVYALEEDLYGLQFYKADFHMHTTYSDGLEPPELVVASARERGLDIIAVTDHNHFDGSVVARQWAQKMQLDMTVVLGEEYSLSYSPMHILALGTDRPIAREFLHADMMRTEAVRQIVNENTNLSCDANAYACTQVLLDEVKRMGGVSILAHPYWKPIFMNGYRMDTPENLFVELGKDRRFTGLELVSGSPQGEWNVSALQASLAREMLGGKFDVPVIGITDSHRYTTDTICGRHFTVVLSASKTEEDVMEALRAARCVAVEMVGDVPLCYGSHRLVKLADFLVMYYFPQRDQKAAVEAMAAKEKYLLQ